MSPLLHVDSLFFFINLTFSLRSHSAPSLDLLLKLHLTEKSVAVDILEADKVEEFAGRKIATVHTSQWMTKGCFEDVILKLER